MQDQNTTIVTLEKYCNSKNLSSLFVDLKALSEGNIVIDAKSISALPTAFIQLLLVTAVQSKSKNCAFSFTNISDELRNDFSLLGITPDLFELEVAA